MIEITQAEVALLGLLCEGEAHPYHLEKTVEFRSMRDWTDLSMSAIYKVLNKLEEKKLVFSKVEIAGGNKTRKTYAVTPLGFEAMRGKLKALLSEPELTKWQIDLATYNIDLLPTKDALAALNVYRQALEKRIQGYKDLAAFLAKEQCPPHRQAVAKRPEYLLKAEIKWVDAFMSELGK